MNRKHLVYVGVILLALVVLTLGGCTGVLDLIFPVTDVGAITWTDDAAAYRGKDNMRFSFTLPAGGVESSIWGTNIYTDDSSIGTAAVHAGVITFATGGKVTIRILPGQSAYTGSTANGVISQDWGAWDGSFEFVK